MSCLEARKLNIIAVGRLTDSMQGQLGGGQVVP